MAKRPESLFFDTNVFINLLRYPEYEARIESYLQVAYLFVVNKIVLMELWAGVQTVKEENILKQYQKAFQMIGLSDDQFIKAGQVMHAMRKKYNFEPKGRRQLTLDILLALSAEENNALILTENEKDFSKIKKFVSFEYISIADH